MKLQCARLRLALRMAPAPIVRTPSQEPPQAANDNQAVWSFVPFPPGWHASSWPARPEKRNAAQAEYHRLAASV